MKLSASRATCGLWLIAAVLLPTTARAECPLIDAAVSLKNASFVFSGTAVNVETRGLYWIVTLSPDEVWKGDPPRQVTVAQINISEAIRFERGGKYLIFAYPYYERTESEWKDAGLFPPPPEFIPPRGIAGISPCDSGPLESDSIKGIIRFFGPGRVPPDSGKN